MWKAWIDESQAGIKTDGRNIKNVRYADDTCKSFVESKWQKVKMNLKASCEGERGGWKSWLKMQHSKN